MTGLQLASFWEGNRAQLFATHVLSSVAAVVPVPVPMDFGHDLLCLLTRRKDNALYAGRAFGVQVKSGSIREIRYGGLNDKQTWKKYELDWLYNQHQPLIICVVDIENWTVNLYTTQFMWWLPNQKGMPGEVVLVPDLTLDNFTAAEGRTSQNRYRSVRLSNAADDSSPGDGFSYYIPLGPPIVSVSVKEQEATDYRDRLRECLDRWLSIDYRNITYRRLNVPYVEEWTEWKKNVPPQPPTKLFHFYNTGKDRNIREILSSISPAIASLMHNLNCQGQINRLNAVKPLANLMKEFGVLDPTAQEFLKDIRV